MGAMTRSLRAVSAKSIYSMKQGANFTLLCFVTCLYACMQAHSCHIKNGHECLPKAQSDTESVQTLRAARSAVSKAH